MSQIKQTQVCATKAKSFNLHKSTDGFGIWTIWLMTYLKRYKVKSSSLSKHSRLVVGEIAYWGFRSSGRVSKYTCSRKKCGKELAEPSGNLRGPSLLFDLMKRKTSASLLLFKFARTKSFALELKSTTDRRGGLGYVSMRAACPLYSR